MKGSPFDLQDKIRGPWRAYLDAMIPLRSELHRYCCKLTGNVWDGEDLVQDTLLRVFGLMGKMDPELANPRAYFIRTATNLWIDRLRRMQREQLFLEEEQATARGASSEDLSSALEVRDAARTLLKEFAPQERAAIVMKELLDLSLEESAAILKTSVGAVKSALHRGRERLTSLEPCAPNDSRQPPRAVVEQFTAALSSKDFVELGKLCSTNVTVELVGGAQMDDFAQGQAVFKFAHLSLPIPGFGTKPRWEVAIYEGEPLVLGFRTVQGVEGLNEIHRLEIGDGKILRVRTYCFCPDTLRVVADFFGIQALTRPYRSPSIDGLTRWPRRIAKWFKRAASASDST